MWQMDECGEDGNEPCQGAASRQKWLWAGRGVRYKLGKPGGEADDKYICLHYRRGEKVISEALGWESDGYSLGQALWIMDVLRANWELGIGPQCLGEIRQSRRKAVGPRGPRLRDFYEEEFRPWSERSKKPVSLRQENSHYRVWIEPFMGHLQLGRITLREWDSMLSAMDAAGRARTTKIYVCGTLLRILRFARDRGERVESPTLRKLGLAGMIDNRRRRVLKEWEIKAILERLRKKDSHAWRITCFAALTGCRFSEAANLEWGHVCADSGITFWRTKTKKSRTIPFSKPLLNLFSGMERGEERELVFKAPHGSKYREAPRAFNKAIQELGLNKGRDRLDRVSFHTLRHTIATKLGAKLDLRTLMDTLGWSQTNMAARYLHGNEAGKKIALDNIGMFLNKEIHNGKSAGELPSRTQKNKSGKKKNEEENCQNKNEE